MASVLYAAESMRLTTRLMQMASWLLLQRAVNNGEMTRDQVLNEKRKVRLDAFNVDRNAPGWLDLPEAFRDPARTLTINLLGTLNLLQALKARGFNRTFLYVSSGDVYGQVTESDLPITEHQPPCPRNPYAVSKLSAEFLSLQWGLSEGWPVVVARPFNHIGTGQKDSFVIASAARQINRIKQGLQAPQLEVGDIDVTRDFLDVGDVVSAYLALLEKGTPGQVYNICSGREQSIRSLIEQLGDLAQVDMQLIQDPARFRRADQRRVCGSSAKLAQTTGWTPEITTQQSLRAILSDWEMRVRQE